MRAGRLRRILQYQLPTEPPDALGQLIPEWVTQSTFFCDVRAPRGTEATVALQVRAFVTLVIETRYPGYTLDPRGRLVDITDSTVSNAIYNIVSSIDPDGCRRRLVTMATEVASAVATNASNL